ncbi:MAG: EAL domain-containing protein [Azoarcus sp.]|jgi:diguanylate cyclase (GGDEF)-like protein/PAS domain S-box-containing protein|nr:EAL domain-containing protein [Azoarcus sp.]
MSILTSFRDASIRIKLLLASTTVQVVLLVLLLANSVRLMDDATRANLDDMIAQNATLLNAMAVAYIDQPNFDPLQDTLGELLTQAEDGLIYVRFGDAAGNILLHSGLPEMRDLPPPDVDSTSGNLDTTIAVLLDRQLVHVRRPLLLPHNQVGFLQFGVSNKQLLEARRSVLKQGGMIAIVEILATIVLLSAIAYVLTSRLTRMVAGSQALAEGELDHRLPDEGGDELTLLARHFNVMASALQQRISDLQSTAERLKSSEERYALSIRGANDGLWDWDIVGDRGHFSPRFYEILGLPVDASASDASPMEAPTTIFYSRLHPDEVVSFHTRLIEHFKGITPQFMIEHRIQHEDGAYRWIMTRGVAQRSANGRAIRMAGSISDIHQRKRAEQQLLHDAMHDGLTGLPNQALFIEHLRQALAQRERDASFRFAVLAINLERFHLINDSYSHAAGDRLLCQVANYFVSQLRGGDIVARLSADQFAILLHGVASTGEALETARHLLELPDFVALGTRQALHMKCRIGLATSEDGGDAETLLRDADNALQAARKGEAAPIKIFQASMHTKVLTTLTLETELRNVLSAKELLVAYQPIVRLFDRSIASFEALARWHHPMRGFISPATFIPLAEALDLIHELGLFMLNRTCLDILEWQRITGTEPPPVSVNLSAKQLARPDLANELFDIIAGHGLAPERLRFEVTESLLTHSSGPDIDTLRKLREAGIAVLIDDFGTGYSALSYLHTIPCDIVKLDGSFIGSVTTDPRLRAIVRHSIGLAHDLGMSVVAECIESEDQSHMLRSIGCDFGQGFLFSKPVPADEACQLFQYPDTRKPSP